MARQLHRLNAKSVATIDKAGRHADGGGLYLVVDTSRPKLNGEPPEKPARRWVFLYRKHGRLREMGLGGIANVSLADARAKAADARRVLGDRATRGDPIAERKRQSGAVPTFGEFADAFV